MTEIEYKKIQIGAPHTPIPMKDNSEAPMGALADYPCITLYSMLEDKSKSGAAEIVDEDDRLTVQDQVYGQLIRDFVSPSMMHLAKFALENRDPEISGNERVFVESFEGEAGTGKTFMLKTFGRMAHPKGAILIECKGRDMGDLLCETVFDTDSVKSITEAIDKKIGEGLRNPSKGLGSDSIDSLEFIYGKAFSKEEREDGTIAISISWKDLPVKGEKDEEKEAHRQLVRDKLESICRNEGIAQTDAGSIGITTRDGTLLRVLDPLSEDYGRPILCDEGTLAKAGSWEKLLGVLSMLTDYRETEITVKGGNNRDVILRREDIPPTFMLSLTDNPQRKGYSSKSLSLPILSRMGIAKKIVPDPTEQEYQDRWCKELTGLPVASMYQAAEEQWSRNHEAFSKRLLNDRKRGLTQEQVDNIPVRQLRYINRWQEVLEISENLGKLMHGLEQRANPNSIYYRRDDTPELSGEYTRHLDGVMIDMRTVQQLMTSAMSVKPKTVPTRHVQFPVADVSPDRIDLSSNTKEPPELHVGDRFSELMVDFITQAFKPSVSGIDPDEIKQVFEDAMKLAADCGACPPDFKEATPSGRTLIAEKMNIDLSKDFTPAEQASYVQEIMCDDMHRRNPDLKAGNDDIIPVSLIEMVLEEISTRKEQGDNFLYVPNSDIETLSDNPFVQIAIDDRALSTGNEPVPDVENLVAQESLLASLIVPQLRLTI